MSFSANFSLRKCRYQLILRKISKIGPPDVSFETKMHEIRFPFGIRPRPRWESLRDSPSPLAVYKGTTSKGKERKVRGEAWGRN